MKRWIPVLLFVCAFTTVIAGNPERESRLKKGDTIYAFVPVSWNLHQQDVGLLPADQLDCSGTFCRYTVPACEPLFVQQQFKDRTHVFPGDERVRKALKINAYHPLGSLFKPPDNDAVAKIERLQITVSGGWSSESGYPRNWAPSRDECLAKVGKQPEQQPSPSPIPSPTPQQ